MTLLVVAGVVCLPSLPVYPFRVRTSGTWWSSTLALSWGLPSQVRAVAPGKEEKGEEDRLLLDFIVQEETWRALSECLIPPPLPSCPAPPPRVPAMIWQVVGIAPPSPL